MNKIINLDDYKNKKDAKTSYLKDEPGYIAFEEDMRIYDRFYDYYGQQWYDRIQNNDNINEEEWLKIWGVHSAKEFLKCWRGNSDEAYNKWRKENGYD